ncbi:MAG: DHHA1 domain-containing protein [Candidatus Thorarchaeota archaeon]|jgi:RecJ-like exonuclease
MESLLESIPEKMGKLLVEASNAVKKSKKVYAFSHIDADGISALAIIVMMLEREGKEFEWKNIHQINSESILQIEEEVKKYKPDLVIFSDFGTGQIELIKKHIRGIEDLDGTIILDHHLPPIEDALEDVIETEDIIEINLSQHGLSGSYDLSGAGTAFLLAYFVSQNNIDLSELAIVGATGDLQDYYGRGFVGINKEIVELAEDSGYITVSRDLTFFGINTRPLPYLLQYATDPYLPGLTGTEEGAYAFYQERKIDVKNNDEWRTWVDLESEEKQKVIQGIIQIVLENYTDPRIAQGIIGDVIVLSNRPLKTEMRSAKELSTLLNACGRNKRPEVGVRICMGDIDAFDEGKTLLRQHRTNLAMALRRLETNRFEERSGMYVVNDPETPDTIIGIVIGMAQGSMIIPTDRPVIGISMNRSSDSPLAKLSGRAHKSLIDKGVNLKEVFVEVAEELNERHDTLIAEAGGHPMAAGAFIQKPQLDEFLELASSKLAKCLGN